MVHLGLTLRHVDGGSAPGDNQRMLPGGRTLRRLKEATSDLHAEAERYVRILDEHAALEDYARYLRAMHGYHAPIEASFAVHEALIASGFDPASRVKLPMVVRDLRTLRDEPCSWCTQLPDLSNLSRAIGAAYVIEGSTLGGRFILSRLPAAIRGVRGTATAFLEGYGDATGEQWRRFGAVVERTITGEGDHEGVIAGARDTFQRLIDWLAQHEYRTDRALREIA